MKTAIVYDRVNKWGGAERVLLALNEMFPKAPLYTSLYNPSTAKWAKVFPKVVPSFLQSIPFAKTRHEYLALFMPLAFESFDFSKFDLVISVTSEAAKGIITTPDTKHVCYCLTPTRYLWSGHKEYLQGSTLQAVSRPAVNYLRQWDRIAAYRPDVMIAISTEVQSRIKKYYNRESEIVFPPTNVKKFQNSNYKKQTRNNIQVPKNKKDYYLLVSRLVKYKKVDLVIEVFNQLKRPLVVVGKGSEERRLRNMASENISFVHNLTDGELVNYYSDAKVLVFPQMEDFGLVAVEAQACGTPVIAFGKGGALDIIVPNKTGVFFKQQTGGSLKEAIKRFEKTNFDQKGIMQNAKRFSKEKFQKGMLKVIK